MGLVKLFIIGTALFTILVAYLMYAPIPGGYSDQLFIRYHVGVTQLATTLGSAAKSLDFNEHSVVRTALRMPKSIISSSANENVTREETTVGGIPVTMFRPAENGEQVKRAVLYFHGDWLSENSDNYAYVCESLAVELNALIIRIEYRMPPKHPYPAALEDSCDMASFFLQHVADFGVHPARVALMGDGFGAGLAAAVVQYLKQNKVKPLPKLQILISPILQAVDFDTPSYQYHHSAVINKRHVARLYSQYVFGNDSFANLLLAKNHTRKEFKMTMAETFMNTELLPKDDIFDNFVRPEIESNGDEEFMKKRSFMFEQHVMLSPLLASEESLKALPVTLIYTCQEDAARDDGIFYDLRLQQAGIKVFHTNFEVCYHDWLEAVHLSRTHAEYFDEIKEMINDKL